MDRGSESMRGRKPGDARALYASNPVSIEFGSTYKIR
jgi:hypothetical protein